LASVTSPSLAEQLCLGDIHLFLAKLMEKHQEVVKESTMGTRVIAQLHEAKSSHIMVGKFDLIFSC
jgi:formate dehydrogenase maturation protein FdhE